MIGGNVYVFTCSCPENQLTGVRLTLNRAGTRAFARTALEISTAC